MRNSAVKAKRQLKNELLYKKKINTDIISLRARATTVARGVVTGF